MNQGTSTARTLFTGKEENDPKVKTRVRADTGRLQQLLTVNQVAAKVWELLDAACSVDAIAGVIAIEFHLTREQAHAETLGLMRIFGEGDMVTVTR
ncbi:MAG: PqqD family protein [Thermoleophilia bacterium]